MVEGQIVRKDIGTLHGSWAGTHKGLKGLYHNQAR